jgi:TPR repeat protein
MLRLYVRFRPLVMALGLGLVAWFNLSVNIFKVPFWDVPAELVDRWFKVAPDLEAAALKAKADQRDALAAYFYALRHTSYCPRDLLIERNPKTAFMYMKQAAEGGRPRAQAVLSLYYLKGIGTDKNPAEARRWAEKAIDHRQPMAHRVLGELHLQAAELALRDAAALADSERGEKLREYGRRSQMALEHLRKAVELGDGGALRVLGEAYDEGLGGLIPNHRQAAIYLEKAALKGNREAAAALSRRYQAEKCAERDPKLAYAWKLVELGLSKDRAQTMNEVRALEAALPMAVRVAGQDQAAQWLIQLPSEEDSARARLDPDR